MSKQEETRDRVLDLMESLDVGQSIPSERQLSIDLGVSRLTVRAALEELGASRQDIMQTFRSFNAYAEPFRKESESYES